MKHIFLILLCLIPILSNADDTQSCHPASNSKLPQYVIGYGSLIQSASKNHTYPNTSNNIPILLTGFKRGWFAQSTSLSASTTFLGVIKDTGSKMNGVVFKAPSIQTIEKYDKREFFYCRELVAPANIHVLNNSSLPQGQYWIYIPQKNAINKPNARYPIVQSYVDIFLSGCFEIQEKYHLEHFAQECIDTTTDWSTYWVNDRIQPRRPFAHQPLAGQIDRLLAEKLPKIFYSIKIE
jgi:hypothetical protein